MLSELGGLPLAQLRLVTSSPGTGTMKEKRNLASAWKVLLGR